MSKKHRLNKGKLEKFGKREEDIVQALQKYDQEHHPKGETLSTPTRVFRMKVVQAFLKSGTPLNIGVRAGGARGAAAPPQILDNSNFFGRREKIWAKPVSVFFKSLFWRDKYFLFEPEVGVIIRYCYIHTRRWLPSTKWVSGYKGRVSCWFFLLLGTVLQWAISSSELIRINFRLTF